MQLLHLNHIQRTYNENSSHPVKALKNISFDVNPGDYIAIMGESGAGKSTLLNIIATLEKANAGEALLNGQDLNDLTTDEAAKYRREHLGFIFQHFNLLDSLSNRDNIYLPLVLARAPINEMDQRLDPLAQSLGITKIIDRYPSEVSGGQQQRIAIARALITHPDLLLADEPTGALDSNTSNEILHLFDTVNQNGQTIIMVTHSAAAASHAKRTLFIKDGQIYHELFRGDKSFKDYQEQISKTMMTLTNGGE
ncbi:ABC transporter ATP-binding protein [Limosilactobacillus fermentum]|uniref:Bacteriocin ABC transporter ATP-binding protein n=3 Tax=Limosilactobacillus fermentum TaxID=1613 RepID=A0A1L7GVJ0_LIMFE|nr:ABC transporter ATP-binding protein [Limosilactobacillus fermentum]APU46077.1 bacteriocin ABC transporter ATP-binding protein [Limosilactobacillus fermentum]AWV30868.1 ABC transporter ATP-binding protein [Limosilactobacillus fermentum]AXH07752.1 ABC transporter ATP-binding protein [Limosilactobacillus fermentum]EEX25712.1 ABC transporter, ATP-binding protein [Limosilactobacillus fermentum 28-3-CHN]ESS00626.1 ABC transporter ATP-binding protein [Limosilactobacillus fermentum NB-22]